MQNKDLIAEAIGYLRLALDLLIKFVLLSQKDDNNDK